MAVQSSPRLRCLVDSLSRLMPVSRQISQLQRSYDNINAIMQSCACTSLDVGYFQKTRHTITFQVQKF